MEIGEPEEGQIVQYEYLWDNQHRSGMENGLKDRPCLIVHVGKVVKVVPITTQQPKDPSLAIKLPKKVAERLGLNPESWIMCDEMNEFVWIGPDLRPVPSKLETPFYGPVPPKLLENVILKALHFREGKKLRVVKRPE